MGFQLCLTERKTLFQNGSLYFHRVSNRTAPAERFLGQIAGSREHMPLFSERGSISLHEVLFYTLGKKNIDKKFIETS